MTPERFRQVRNLFEAALERDAHARSAFVAEACRGDATLRAEVGRLLAAHGEPDALLDQSPLLSTDPGGGPERMEGRRIDHYEILRELGGGGMGSVYLAVRTDDVYRKPVALKVVRPEARSEEVLQRFRQEREIVAGLDHPHIARLLDGGVTPEGLPYFVMDYVEGQPIDVYCDEHLLSVDQRLALFQSVCSAVEYAHRQGIVHRDLKPSNIMVTSDGVAKLLDFGIAKLLRRDTSETIAVTRTGLRLMTPEYASPEQVRGDSVDAATDVYSLGVVLYELLTGHRPYRMRSRMIHEVVRVICEEDPTRPSVVIKEVEERGGTDGDTVIQVTPQSVSRTRETTVADLRRQLSGELDNIVMKALSKEPLGRYRTARDFSDDVRRHLEGSPVLAQGQGLLYRASKLLIRYRAAAAVGALLVVGLATGAVRVSVLAVNVAGVTLQLLLFTYLFVRLHSGAAIARKRLFPLTVICFSCAFVLALVASRRDILGPSVYISLLGAALWLPAGLIGAVRLARWPRRERWAGPLLLDLSVPRNLRAHDWARATAMLLGLLMLSSIIVLFVVASIRVYARTQQSSYLFFASIAAPSMVIVMTQLILHWRRVEIRSHGVVTRRGLIPWTRIESFAWEPSEGGFAILKMRVRRSLPFKPILTHRFIVPAERRREADAILGGQFAEWPGSPGKRTFQLSDAFFTRVRQNQMRYTFPLLAIGLALSFYSNFDRTMLIPSVIAVTIVVAIVITASYSAARRQMKLWRTFRITVDADSLTRVQDGFADVILPADRITRIEEIPDQGLLVYSEGSEPAVTIPDALIDYEACRSLLSQWRPVERRATPILIRFRWPASLALISALVPSYFSADPRLVLPAGAVMMGLSGYVFFAMRRSPDIDQRTKRIAWVFVFIALQALVRMLSVLSHGRP